MFAYNIFFKILLVYSLFKNVVYLRTQVANKTFIKYLDEEIGHPTEAISYNENGYTKLHEAAEEGHENNVKLLLSCPNHRLLMTPTNDDTRQTALHLAVINGHLTVVKCLLQNGADVNAKDFNIIIKGKDVNNPHFSNWSPLHYAAGYGHLEIVKALVEIGRAEVDIKDFSGGTPLQRAVKFGHLYVVMYLEGKSANINSIDKTLVSVLTYAVRTGHDHIVRYLLEKGADINSVDRNGMSVLFHAAKCNQWKTVQCLVEHKADLNMADKKGAMPLDVVVKAGKWDVVKYLLENGAVVDKDKFRVFKSILQKFSNDYQFLPEIERNNASLLESIRTNRKAPVY